MDREQNPEVSLRNLKKPSVLVCMDVWDVSEGRPDLREHIRKLQSLSNVTHLVM